jgi:chromosome segregation ATPase
MSKPTTLSSIIGSLFGRSEKAISEKLSTEEHEGFAADVNELNSKLEAQIADNETINASLITANETIAGLQGQLTESQTQITSLNASLTSMTANHDKYKAHYDLTAGKGDNEAGIDHNSRGASAKTGYNENAMAVWQKANK